MVDKILLEDDTGITLEDDTGSLLNENEALTGSICWGHDTAVEEDNVRDLSLWSGTGDVSGSGDAEAIELNGDEYMESPTWNIGAGDVRLRKDVYSSGAGTPTIYYKQGDSESNCEADTWHEYVSTFACSGWVKVRVVNNGD